MKRLTTCTAILLALSIQAQSNIPLGNAPTQITVEVENNAPIEEVWAALSDIGGIFLNSPTADTSYASSVLKRGVGTTRHILLSPMMKKGATLDERVSTW
jgi:hypothetical protein